MKKNKILFLIILVGFVCFFFNIKSVNACAKSAYGTDIVSCTDSSSPGNHIADMNGSWYADLGFTGTGYIQTCAGGPTGAACAGASIGPGGSGVGNVGVNCPDSNCDWASLSIDAQNTNHIDAGATATQVPNPSPPPPPPIPPPPTPPPQLYRWSGSCTCMPAGAECDISNTNNCTVNSDCSALPACVLPPPPPTPPAPTPDPSSPPPPSTPPPTPTTPGPTPSTPPPSTPPVSPPTPPVPPPTPPGPTFMVTISPVPIHGSITSNPTGINCGATCTYAFPQNSSVSFSAIPVSSYWKFTGWAGNCSGTGSCTLILNSDKTISATFAPRSFIYREF